MTNHHPRHVLLLAAGLCALAGACALSPSYSGAPERSIFTNPGQPAAGEAQLYARDGTVIGASGALPAAQERSAPAKRGVGEGESGRMYLLELYQQVIDERDSLSREVHALRADLEVLHAAQAQGAARIGELEQHSAGLTAERERLQAENLDLAARLTTAQIRRLQAERLLLEHKIAEQKLREAAQAEEAGSEGRQP